VDEILTIAHPYIAVISC